MTAKRSHPRIPILLRLEPEELARVDRARVTMGDTDRAAFIRKSLESACWFAECLADMRQHPPQFLTDGA